MFQEKMRFTNEWQLPVCFHAGSNSNRANWAKTEEDNIFSSFSFKE